MESVLAAWPLNIKIPDCTVCVQGDQVNNVIIIIIMSWGS